MKPDISVIIPAHNEASLITQTIEAIADAREAGARLEFVVVDDASSDGTATVLAHSSACLRQRRDVRLQLFRMEERAGVPVARNWGAAHASAETLFITDAHVRPSSGWDRQVLDNIRANRILAAVLAAESGMFRGYGCRLTVPGMGTWWNKGPVAGMSPVQIASCAGTGISCELFRRLGGYDFGMPLYGGAEPEFSVRAWLQGCEVMVLPSLLVRHRFKDQAEREPFLRNSRVFMVYNRLRFGLLYLGDLGCLQLVRYFAARFPDDIIESVLQMVSSSDLWERRKFLEQRRQRRFDWFVERFGIRDEVGREILQGEQLLCR